MERNEFTGAVTYGVQRIGKTSYSAQVLYDICHDWKKVFRLTMFEMSDVLKLLEELVETDVKIECFTWDDAGVHAGKNLWFTDKKKVDELKALFDVIGTATRGIIFTTPNAMDMLKVIRNYEFYRIKISKKDDVRRLATGYQIITLPSGTQMVSKRFIDQYNVMLPDEFYNEYNPVRKGYLKKALLRIKSTQNAANADIDVESFDEMQYHEEKERSYSRRPQGSMRRGFAKKEKLEKLELANNLLDNPVMATEE